MVDPVGEEAAKEEPKEEEEKVKEEPKEEEEKAKEGMAAEEVKEEEKPKEGGEDSQEKPAEETASSAAPENAAATEWSVCCNKFLTNWGFPEIEGICVISFFSILSLIR